jgi:hypothetical protein
LYKGFEVRNDRHIVQTAGIQEWWNVIDGRTETLGGECLYVTLSTANPTWTALGMNSGLCDEEPVTV